MEQVCELKVKDRQLCQWKHSTGLSHAGHAQGRTRGILLYSSWLLNSKFSPLEILKGPGKFKHHEAFRIKALSALETPKEKKTARVPQKHTSSHFLWKNTTNHKLEDFKYQTD